MFRNSVARQVLAMQWIAVTVIFAVSLLFAISAWTTDFRARELAKLVDLDRLLFASAAGIRLEIGTVGVSLLEDDDPQSGVARGLGAMTEANRRAQAALAASTLEDRKELLSRLGAAADGFDTANRLVSAEAALPRGEREASRVEPWRMAVYKLAGSIDDASSSVGRDLRALDAAIGELVAIRQMSFTIRDRYSRQCSAFRPAVQTDTPLTPEERDRWRENIGAYSALWAQMKRIAEQLPAEMGFTPLVEKGLQQTMAAQVIMTRTIENLSGSGRPAYDAAAWSRNCISAYAPILNIGSRALDLEIAHAAGQRSRAFAVGAASTTFLVLVVVLGFASLHFVRHRLSSPMRQIEEALVRLRAGDFDTPIALPPWKDELSGIAGALEGFRTESLNARRLRMRIDALHDEFVDHAERIARTKSQFLATMSHEIRTPLHGILGTVQLLAASPVSDEQRLWVQALEQSGRLLRDILDDILDFTRLESGRVTTEIAPFRLRERIAMVEATIAPGAARKGLAFEVTVDPDLPEIAVGDAGKLSQILLNLLGNAIKFTEQGGVRLTVAAAPNAASGLRLIVADTGIGIPVAAVPHIFEPFAQADGSVARRFGGSGLGLAVCRAVLDGLGGKISLETEVGRGTTFTVFFPLAATDGTVGAAPAADEALPALDVLVAEDNPVNALIVRTMLERDGHRVAWVETGRAAVAMATARDFDVILMDLAMPELDGASACRQIRAGSHATRSVVPILAVSAGGAAASDIDAGFDGWLEKPFRREDLAAALAEAIGLKPHRIEHQREHLGAISEQARDLGVEGARKLVALYLSSQPAVLAETVAAARHGDRVRARALAHRLKGAAAHVGATAMVEAIAVVERAAVADDPDGLAAAIAALLEAARTHFADFAATAETELARFEGSGGQATFSVNT